MENYTIIFCSLLILTTTITIHPISGVTDFSFSTDKTVYLQRDTIFITGEATKVSNYKGTIEVVNTLGATIKFIEFVIPADKTTFSSQIGIFGAEWNKDGLYQVVVTIDEETRTKFIHIFSTSSGIKSSISSTISFDKSRYSWTDTVTIYLIGYSYNLNNKLTESLGDSKEKHIKISTSQGTLDSYKLVETAPDSGIFSGIVILTGQVGYDLNRDKKIDTDGYTGGAGPDGGRLGVFPNDEIRITFTSDEESLSQTADVEFTVGSVEWDEETFLSNSQGIIRVKDPDLKLSPDLNDRITVLVWSDHQQDKKIFTLSETGKRTGIFEGTISFSSELNPSSSYLFSPVGSKVYVKYIDYSLPNEFKATTNEVTAEAAIIMEEKIPLAKEPEVIKEKVPLIGEVKQFSSNAAFGIFKVDKQRFVISPYASGFVTFSGEIIDIPKGSSVYVTVIKPDKTADQLKVRISNNNEFQAQWIIDKESQEGVYLASASYGDIASGQVGFEITKASEKIITKRIAVPEWIKNSARWWANNQISDQDFTDGLAFLIKEGTIQVEKKSVKQTTSDKIPEWIKNTARWWSEGSIGNEDFVKGIEYLIENGIIKV